MIMHLYNRLGKPHFNFKGDIILSPGINHENDVANVKIQYAENIINRPKTLMGKIKLTIRVMGWIW